MVEFHEEKPISVVIIEDEKEALLQDLQLQKRILMLERKLITLVLIIIFSF